jgi:acetylglutamate kinase
MAPMSEVLRNLLGNLANRSEVERYLRRFTSVEPSHFGVVKVGGGVLRDDMDELASSLAFLHRVGLLPIVIHGAGPQLDDALVEAGIESTRLDGMRVTTPEVLAVFRRTLAALNHEIVEALAVRNAAARPIVGGVFEASLLDAERLGMVGQVDGVDLAPIEAAVRSGQIPVVACIGETATGQIVNINADVAARALALEVEPHKLIFLTGTGGLLDAHDEIIPAINLVEDYEALIAEEWVTGGMELKLKEIKQILEGLPRSSSVSITSPQHLAAELFTDKGSGTLVRQGEPIDVLDDLSTLDLDQVHALLEEAFGRGVDRRHLEEMEPHRVFVSADRSAIAIVTIERGIPYLDKFAVTAESQGVGLGVSIWNRMTAEIPRLYWRSREGNPLNTWYFRKADGAWRQGDWVVYWYGLDSAAEIAACREYALSMRPTVEAPS